MELFARETAIIDEGCRIRNHPKVGHFNFSMRNY